jgi:O-antigen biosynthesis protein
MNLQVSIIIPFKDQVELLQRCISSVLQHIPETFEYELILVNNQSFRKKTALFLEKIQQNEKISLFSYDKPFNFSAINNFSAKEAKGEFLLFLNNDTEVISEYWLDAMVEHFRDSAVGVVGAKLLYANGTIQHAGVEVRNGNAAHSFGRQKDSKDVNAPFNKVRECEAVTAACMMTRKSLFEDLGGFDEESLAIAYNDVDYCFRVREKGYKVIYEPKAVLYHYESATRGRDILKRFLHPKRYKQFLAEREFLKERWFL